MKRLFEITNDVGRSHVMRWLQEHEYPIYITATNESKRNTAQNRLLWSVLTDISRQVRMRMFDGQELKASQEDWKDYLTAVFYKEQKVAQGENGEAILIGRSTSRMRKKEFSEFIECIYAFGANRGVIWTDSIPAEYEKWANYGTSRA